MVPRRANSRVTFGDFLRDSGGRGRHVGEPESGAGAKGWFSSRYDAHVIRWLAVAFCVTAGLTACVSADKTSILLLLVGVMLVAATSPHSRVRTSSVDMRTHVLGGIDDPWIGGPTTEPLRGIARAVLLSQPRR
jgi:hypothetical protein